MIDTDVFSVVYVRDAGQRARALKERLTGRIPVIATQTRAELLVWPRQQGWGQTRADRLAELITATTTVPVTDDVVEAYAELSVACRQAGHPLHQKVHAGDRWIAATAMALDRPLLSLDRVFDGTPGLTVLSGDPG